MTELDERIRSGLIAATNKVGQLEPQELAERLGRREAEQEAEQPPTQSGEPAHRSSRRLLALAAAIALIGGVVGVGLFVSQDPGGSEQVVTDRPDSDPSTGFAGWSPGWHELDTGPLPEGEPPSLAWFDGRLYAAATLRSPNGEADQTDTAGFWAFDPVSRKWSELEPPPFRFAELVATSTGLVAVGGPTPSSTAPPRELNWATWSPGDTADPSDGWSTHGEMPVSESLRRAGSPGPTSPHVRRSLLWTGKVVIDFTAGTVLDPHDGSAEPLEMPEDLVPYTHLIAASPVWTGTRAVVVGWSPGPGLSWDGEGHFIGEVPGPPMADTMSLADAAAVSVAGDAVIFGFEHSPADPGVARVDSDNRWEPLPSVPNSTREWCPYYRHETVSQEVIVQGCDLGAADGDSSSRTYYRWKGDAWSAIPDPPRSEHGMQRWLGTDQALVVWSSDIDSFNNPSAPFQWAAVWIPDDSDPQRADISAPSVVPSTAPTSAPAAGQTDPTTDSTSPSPTQCNMDQLPDIRGALPESLDVEPAPGIGGLPSSDDLCARHWTNPDDPGRHITQQSGGLSFPIVDARQVGPLRWGEIHEGYGIEYWPQGALEYAEPTHSSSGWGLTAYGLEEQEVEMLVERLAERLEQGT